MNIEESHLMYPKINTAFLVGLSDEELSKEFRKWDSPVNLEGRGLELFEFLMPKYKEYLMMEIKHCIDRGYIDKK